jgi:hypothetical protein
MDLSCPVEFRGVEVLRDSGGRAQAYLTFMNLSRRALTELDVMVTMLDAQGASMGIRPLRYRAITARGRAAFTLCMVMDDLPFFEDVRVTIRRVGFEKGDVWHCDEDALMDCTVDELPPGPDRVALVAVAGTDALCWPEERRDTWVCVCGRFNENNRLLCRRCGRAKADTFAHFQPGAVREAYLRQKQRALEQERTQRDEATAAARTKQARRQQDYARRYLALRRRRRLLWVGLTAALLVIWGLWNAGIAVVGALTQQTRPAGRTALLPTSAPYSATPVPTRAPATAVPQQVDILPQIETPPQAGALSPGGAQPTQEPPLG